jgi:hypothetical protein
VTTKKSGPGPTLCRCTSVLPVYPFFVLGGPTKVFSNGFFVLFFLAYFRKDGIGGQCVFLPVVVDGLAALDLASKRRCAVPRAIGSVVEFEKEKPPPLRVAEALLLRLLMSRILAWRRRP